jgi:hypothetical protein
MSKSYHFRALFYHLKGSQMKLLNISALALFAACGGSGSTAVPPDPALAIVGMYQLQTVYLNGSNPPNQAVPVRLSSGFELTSGNIILDPTHAYTVTWTYTDCIDWTARTGCTATTKIVDSGTFTPNENSGVVFHASDGQSDQGSVVAGVLYHYSNKYQKE